MVDSRVLPIEAPVLSMPWLLALALAACGAPPAVATGPSLDNRGGAVVTPVAPGPAAIDWAAVASMQPYDAIAIWQQLDVRGANLAAVLARIEAEGAVAVDVMAEAVLDDYSDGDECVVVVDPYVSPVEREIPEVQPTDDFSHRCVRRALQLWALRVLPVARLQGDLRDSLISIARTGEPEDELIRAAYARVTDEALLLGMLAETEQSQETIADELVLRLSEAGRVTAAVTLAIDGALLALDARVATDAYLAALDVGRVRDATQITAIERLTAVATAADRTSAVRARIVAGLAAARHASDCVVAATAIDAHAGLTGGGFPLDLATPTEAYGYLGLMCRAVTSRLDATALWRTLIPAGGLTLEVYDSARTDALWAAHRDAPDANDDGVPDVAAADPDGNGDPFTQVITVRVPRRGRFVMPYSDRLPAVFGWCMLDLSCSDYHGATATFEFAPGAGGRLQLTHIRWRIEPDLDY